jgi:hypothetical protein
MDFLRNLIEPPKLTGQVVMDGSEPRFKGNYSYVYRGVFKGESVLGLHIGSHVGTNVISV